MADISFFYRDKYSYSVFGISFDMRGAFSLKSVNFGKNLIISGVDMSSSVQVDNKKMIFYFLVKLQQKV